MTRDWTTILMSALMNGLISASGIVISAIVGNNELSQTTWILCAAWFVFAMAKDIQARIAQPPEKAGP